MNTLSSFLTVMVALSVGVERVIELLKGTFPRLAATQPDEKKEKRRHAILQILAVLCGTGISYLARSQISTMPGLPANTAMHISGCVLLGLLASGGSAMWNHALDIARATKVSSENAAKAAGGAP